MRRNDISVLVIEDAPQLLITQKDLEKEFKNNECLGKTILTSTEQLYSLFSQMHNEIVNSTQRIISSKKKIDLGADVNLLEQS